MKTNILRKLKSTKVRKEYLKIILKIKDKFSKMLQISFSKSPCA